VAEDLVARRVEVAVPLGRARPPGDHHDEQVRPAGSQHVEDFGKDEQLPPDLAHRVATSGHMDLLGMHGTPSSVERKNDGRERVYYYAE
jgi:hypothetical protein